MSEKLSADVLDRPPFGWLSVGLILYSVVCFSVETLPGLSSQTLTFLYYSEVVVVMLFTVEYLARLMLAEKPLKFVFSFYGLIDLLAILPFYLATSVDLRSVRILRFLRLLRILKLGRYSQAFGRFARALMLAKEEMMVFLMASFLMLYLASVGIYYFENPAQPDKFSTIFDCMWWAVATLTTVGYGDIYPITVGGRVFTFAILMVGLGLVAVPTGLIASALSEVRNKEQK